MYIQTSKHHIEHINSITYDKGSGLYINGSKFGVRPDELLERSRYDSENR